MQIKKGQIRKLGRGKVHCEAGCIWLTEQGRDIILKAGQSHHISRLAIIEGLKDSCIQRERTGEPKLPRLAHG